MGRTPDVEPELVWGAAPIRPKQRSGLQWDKLLDQIRAAPGCEARIQVRSTRSHANNDIARIRKRFREQRPYEKWRLRIATLQDDSGVFGVFATFQGVMTESEYQLQQEAFARRSAQMKTTAKKSATIRKLRREELSLSDILQLRAPGQ
jgi:hypothetical protein